MKTEPVSLRVAVDLLKWFRSLGKGYQRRMHDALVAYRRMCDEIQHDGDEE
jgi:uncharacterized protein (DUF4415 family)